MDEAVDRENIGEARILETLDGLFARYAGERAAGEHFGDFCGRAGLVPAPVPPPSVTSER